MVGLKPFRGSNYERHVSNQATGSLLSRQSQSLSPSLFDCTALKIKLWVLEWKMLEEAVMCRREANTFRK